MQQARKVKLRSNILINQMQRTLKSKEPIQCAANIVPFRHTLAQKELPVLCKLVFQLLIWVVSAAKMTTLQTRNIQTTITVIEVLSSMILIPIPWNNRSHKFSTEEQDFHLEGYFLASNLCGIFAAKEKQKHKFSLCEFLCKCQIFHKLEHEYTMV